MIGQTISHYNILEKLGEGGMGIVYKAEDTKLKRTVALKFLPHHLLANEEDKTRFLHEAQAASALNHPNIMTIHEIDEVEDPATASRETFIVMELVEGVTLKDKLEKRPLKTKELLNIAIAVAEGLNAAHEKEIVHRDIKSENIIISKTGIVKIMDFGLAKRKGMSRITKAGSTLGTLAYMSPEQAEGSDVDRRSDLFSFGVVMYEMATGQLPFKGEHDAAILYSIVYEAPLPVTTLNPNIPQELERIIHKALEKNPERRYPDMKAMIEELKAASIRGITIPKQEESIVVLPFVNMSPDPDQEYFSDGLTEEIITDLTKIYSLRVISSNSAMILKGSQKPTKTIARELNVQYILEGSVRKAGNNIRITAQLIDVRNDTHLWADKYSGTLDDIFEIQENVSYEIVNELKLKLSLEEKEKMGEHLIQDIRAMECWLRAKQEIHHYTKESLDRAVAMIEDGLKVVGDNVLLFWGLGYINWFYVNMGIHLDTKYLDKAEEFVDKIFRLDPNSFHGFQLLGLIAYKRGDVRKSIEYTKRALEIEPNNPEALDHIVWMYADVGKTEKSGKLIDRLLSIDPLTPHNHWAKGLTLFVKGHLKESINSFQKSYELESDNYAWRYFYSLALYTINERTKADVIADVMEKETPDNFLTRMLLFTKNALEGDKDKALQMVTDEMKSIAEWDEIVAWLLSRNYALVDDKDNAMYYLQNAVNIGFINYPFLTKYDPFLDNIRGEDLFKKLMQRVKYEWENFEV